MQKKERVKREGEGERERVIQVLEVEERAGNEANTFHHTFITPSLSTPHISPIPHPPHPPPILPQPPTHPPPPIFYSLTCMLIVVFHLLEEVCPPFPPPQLPLQVLHVATVVLCQQLTLQALQLSLRLHQQTHNPGETCKGVATDYRVQ